METKNEDNYGKYDGNNWGKYGHNYGKHMETTMEK